MHGSNVVRNGRAGGNVKDGPTGREIRHVGVAFSAIDPILTSAVRQERQRVHTRRRVERRSAQVAAVQAAAATEQHRFKDVHFRAIREATYRILAERAGVQFEFIPRLRRVRDSDRFHGAPIVIERHDTARERQRVDGAAFVRDTHRLGQRRRYVCQFSRAQTGAGVLHVVVERRERPQAHILRDVRIKTGHQVRQRACRQRRNNLAE